MPIVCQMSAILSARPASNLDIAVIGAGMGGLAAAIRLAASGARVTVFEAAERAGGKASGERLGSSGLELDAGPTVLTLPDVFESLFEAAGARLAERVTLRPATVLARHFWRDGVCLDLFSEPARTRQGIVDTFGEGEGRGYDRFVRHAAAILSLVEGPFIRSQRPTVWGTLRSFGLSSLTDVMRIDALRSLWTALGDFFETPHLRQLFARYATYVGSSPLQAPATLAVIAGVELAGVYTVEGGIRQLVAALVTLAGEVGVEIRTSAPVAEIDVAGGRVVGVRLSDGRLHRASAVVANVDPTALTRGLLGAASARAVEVKGERSLSAVTFTGLLEAEPSRGAQREGPELTHHNVFFAADAVAEARSMFEHGVTPAEPTLYLCAQDRPPEERSSPAQRPERVLALVNAAAIDARPAGRSDPGTTSGDNRAWSTKSSATAQLTTLSTRLGLPIRWLETASVRLPADWEALSPGSGGSLYGRASHGWRQAFLRPGARTKLTGLYLAGGAIHPGAGLPMATLSGARAAEALLEDLASMRPSMTTATPGGTSMSSRTTDDTR